MLDRVTRISIVLYIFAILLAESAVAGVYVNATTSTFPVATYDPSVVQVTQTGSHTYSIKLTNRLGLQFNQHGYTGADPDIVGISPNNQSIDSEDTVDISSIVSEAGPAGVVLIVNSSGDGQRQFRNIDSIHFDRASSWLAIYGLVLSGRLGPAVPTQGIQIEASSMTFLASSINPGKLELYTAPTCGIQVVGPQPQSSLQGFWPSDIGEIKINNGDIVTPVLNDYGRIARIAAENGSIVDTTSGPSRFSAQGGIGSLAAYRPGSDFSQGNIVNLHSTSVIDQLYADTDISNAQIGDPANLQLAMSQITAKRTFTGSISLASLDQYFEVDGDFDGAFKLGPPTLLELEQEEEFAGGAAPVKVYIGHNFTANGVIRAPALDASTGSNGLWFQVNINAEDTPDVHTTGQWLGQIKVGEPGSDVTLTPTTPQAGQYSTLFSFIGHGSVAVSPFNIYGSQTTLHFLEDTTSGQGSTASEPASSDPNTQAQRPASA